MQNTSNPFFVKMTPKKAPADKPSANWSLDWKPQREFQIYQLTNAWWKKIADVTKEPVKISEEGAKLV